MVFTLQQLIVTQDKTGDEEVDIKRTSNDKSEYLQLPILDWIDQESFDKLLHMMSYLLIDDHVIPLHHLCSKVIKHYLSLIRSALFSFDILLNLNMPKKCFFDASPSLGAHFVVLGYKWVVFLYSKSYFLPDDAVLLKERFWNLLLLFASFSDKCAIALCFALELLE